MTDNLWQATGIPVRPRPSLDGHQTVDVCVIGGGVGGTASTYFMSRNGATVILLEADRIGSGAAGKSSGFVNAGLWAPPASIFKTIGEIYGARLIALLGELAGLDGVVNRQWVSRKIARLFPILRGVEVTYAWTGCIGITTNHMPTIHRLGPQAYALGGYNGRGIAAATVRAGGVL